MFDAVDIENAFISVICDPSDDPDVIEECCIYLGLMWKRKNNANRDFLKQIPPELSEKIVWGMEHDITERAL